jgi:hypothetical protein
MGIRFACPNGHKLNVKEHLAGKRGICPSCGAKFLIPAASNGNDQPAETSPTSDAAPAATFPKSDESPPSTDPGSMSVVIPVVDQPVPPTQLPMPTGQPTESPAQPSAEALSEVAIKTTPESPEPPPVSIYAVRRARNRRLQMRIALMLLIAVVALAVVLVWVLRRGPVGAPPADQAATRLVPNAQQAYVANLVLGPRAAHHGFRNPIL